MVFGAFNIFQSDSSYNSSSTNYGIFYNINNFFNILASIVSNVDNYGANSTVNYFVPIYSFITPDIKFRDTLFPLANLGKNDYIIFQIQVPDEFWLNNHNLFNMTPYFYNYNCTDDPDGGNPYTVFASIDITIPFFDNFNKSTSGNVINICVTASKDIGNYYEGLGYIISKVPIEYINLGTFLPLIRVGITNKYTFNINDFVKTSYTKGEVEESGSGGYYSSEDIIKSFPETLIPDDSTFQNNLSQFDSIVSYLKGLSTITNFTQSAKFLSVDQDVDYAFDNFFAAITKYPPVNIQANNTGENYFNSTDIQLSNLANQNEYLYVLSVNQNKMEIALTSNIQIYDRTVNSEGKTSNSVIENGTIKTSPEIPVFTEPTYPYIAEGTNTLPLFQLNYYDINTLLSMGIKTIIIVERLSYNPINFYHSSYDYTGSAYVFTSPLLTSDQIFFLESTYDITINEISQT